MAGLDCIAIAGKAKKQCVCCGPKCADPHPGQCFDQPSLVKFLNAQPVSTDTAAGYSVVPVHVWAFNLSQLAAVVKQLGTRSLPFRPFLCNGGNLYKSTFCT